MTETLSDVAIFADRAAAQTLVKFLSASHIACHIGDAPSGGLGRYRVCVASNLLDRALTFLAWTSLAIYDDPTSAEVVAGRLVRDGIPCYLGGRSTLDHYGMIGRWSGPYEVLVPNCLLKRAQDLIKEPPLSDEELTRAALRYHEKP